MQGGNLIVADDDNMPVSGNFAKHGAGLINQPGANGNVIGAGAKTNCQTHLCHSFMTYCVAR